MQPGGSFLINRVTSHGFISLNIIFFRLCRKLYFSEHSTKLLNLSLDILRDINILFEDSTNCEQQYLLSKIVCYVDELKSNNIIQSMKNLKVKVDDLKNRHLVTSTTSNIFNIVENRINLAMENITSNNSSNYPDIIWGKALSFAPGDIIKVHQVGFNHYGVVSSNGMLLNYISDKITKKPVCSTFDFFSNGKILYKIQNLNNDETLKRAENFSMLKDYDLIYYNCEHFMTYCITGTPISSYFNRMVSASKGLKKFNELQNYIGDRNE